MVKSPWNTIQSLIFHHVSWFSWRISAILWHFPIFMEDIHGYHWISYIFQLSWRISHVFPRFSHENFRSTTISQPLPDPKRQGPGTPGAASAAARHDAPEPRSPKSWSSKRLEEWETKRSLGSCLSLGNHNFKETKPVFLVKELFNFTKTGLNRCTIFSWDISPCFKRGIQWLGVHEICDLGRFQYKFYMYTIYIYMGY